MFNCDDVVHLLTEYVDGELDAGSQADLDHHFSGCPHCVGFLTSFKTTIELTGTFRCEDIPDEVSKKLHAFLAERLRLQDLGEESL